LDRGLELLWSKWNTLISDLFEQIIEDKIRRSFTASPPSNVSIYCIDCHNPFLEKNGKILVCTAERRGTELVVSQWCCGEGGHAPIEPEGNILKPIIGASIADSSASHVFEIYYCIDRRT
jgi:hypothetical protein